jgi:hypothetical protein
LIDATPLTYRQVLRDRRLATLLAGDAVAKVGDGMNFVALPLLALALHGTVPAALAVALVTGAPYLLPIGVSLFFGLGRRRFDPRLILLVDSAVRTVMLTVLGALGLAGRLTLPILVVTVLVGSTMRLLSASARRLVATGMVTAEARLAVNGLLGTSDNLALYVAGPALGGVMVAVHGPDLVLVASGVGQLALLAAAAVAVPGAAGRAARAETAAQRTAPGAASGWTIMRRTPVALRLFLVVFLFDLFYGPVEVALPLLVTRHLDGDGGAFGALWASFGAGALVGALFTNRLRRVPQKTLLVVVIGGWSACAAGLGVAPDLRTAGVALAIGGAIYGPFLAVAYTLLQSLLGDEDQQPVFTLWAAGVTVAMPLGLAVGGPMVAAAGPRGGILISALITALLVPVAARYLRPQSRALPSP